MDILALADLPVTQDFLVLVGTVVSLVYLDTLDSQEQIREHLDTQDFVVYLAILVFVV